MTYQVAGVMQSPPDQRDIPYVQRTFSFPRKFSLRDKIGDIENQGKIGACVAHGVTSTLESHLIQTVGHQDLSRRFVYDAGRHLENRLGQSGMFVRTAYRVAHKFGVPLESDYPYTDTSEAGEDPPAAAYEAAAARKISRYEFIYNRDSVYGTPEPWQIIDRIKSALLEGIMPTVAFGVTSSIYAMKGPWLRHRYDDAAPFIGGHLMYITGWDDDAGLLEIVNSWGQSWGEFAFGGFPYSIVSAPWFESWIARGFAGVNVPEAPGIKLEYKNAFSVGFRIVPPPEMVGRTVSVWIGAKLQSKQIYLKQSLDADEWLPMLSEQLLPAGYAKLTEAVPLKAVNWMPLDQFAGADIYVAYGNSPMDWHKEKLCTI
jgi:hypothetical protein